MRVSLCGWYYGPWISTSGEAMDACSVDSDCIGIVSFDCVSDFRKCREYPPNPEYSIVLFPSSYYNNASDFDNCVLEKVDDSGKMGYSNSR